MTNKQEQTSREAFEEFLLPEGFALILMNLAFIGIDLCIDYGRHGNPLRNGLIDRRKPSYCLVGECGFITT